MALLVCEAAFTAESSVTKPIATRTPAISFTISPAVNPGHASRQPPKRRVMIPLTTEEVLFVTKYPNPIFLIFNIFPTDNPRKPSL
jgi:hypothetical protein